MNQDTHFKAKFKYLDIFDYPMDVNIYNIRFRLRQVI